MASPRCLQVRSKKLSQPITLEFTIPVIHFELRHMIRQVLVGTGHATRKGLQLPPQPQYEER